MVVFSTTSKLPVYYDIYDGSINDKTGFLNVLDHYRNLGFDIDKTFFIIDRGFYSKQNIETLLELKIKFLLAVTSTYIHVQEKIKEIGDISSGRKHMIPMKNDICFGASAPYGIYDGKINLFLFKTLERRKLDEIKLNQKLERIEQVLSKKQRLDDLDDIKIFYEDVNEELTKSDYKFALTYYDFKLDEEKKVVEYKREEDKLDELSNSLGYFTFISNVMEKKPEEVLYLYKFRSRSEQAFDSLKCDLDNEKIRTHNENTRRGKLFVSFLTLIYKCYIENKIFEHQDKYDEEKKKGKPKILNLEKKTPSQMLRDLALLRTTDAYTKKDFELEYEPSKMQTTMLELFNIDKDYVKTTLKELSKK
jgi:transposase